MSDPKPAFDLVRWLYELGEVVAGFLAFAAVVTFGVLVKRYSVFKFQDDAIANLNTAYASLEKRFGEEVSCRKELETKVHEQEIVIAELRGAVGEKQHSLDDAYLAAVRSGGCDDAFVCKLRKVPGEHLLRASSTPSPNGVETTD